MRFRVSLRVQKFEHQKQLPLTYHNQLYEWLAGNLWGEESLFRTWLSENNWFKQAKNNSFFTFSDFTNIAYIHAYNSFKIDNEIIEFTISFLPFPKWKSWIIDSFINKEIPIRMPSNFVGLRVVNVVELKEPLFSNTMKYKCISPLVVKYRDYSGISYSEFMFPRGERFYDIFINLLRQKHSVVTGQMNQKELDDYKYSVELKGSMSSDIHNLFVDSLNIIQVRGYLIEFTLNAPVELHKTLFYTGIGDYTHLGFGCCDVI